MGILTIPRGRLYKVLTNKRLRPFLITALAAFIITEIVALQPAPLEINPDTASGSLELESLMPENQAVLAPGIPKDRVPEYTVEKFNDVSVQGSVKQWNLVADRAFLYNTEKLVHAKVVQALLYDPDGHATIVTGKEAKYFMNKRDLEIFGDVKTKFPDGFEVHSEYLRYHPNERLVEIPTKWPVLGDGDQEDGKHVHFTSGGLNFAMGKSEITLLSNVHFRVTEPPPAAPTEKDKDAAGTKPSSASSTTIESDHCVIHRDQQLAYFTMFTQHPDATRYVHVNQPTMNAKGRRAKMNYGDFSSMLHYLTIEEDVTIRELPDPDKPVVPGEKVEPRWGTGGQADFDNRRDVVVLSEYPQVYQGDDTVTGDVIVLHRDTDIVEVENSNAFSKGSSGTESP